MLLSFGGQLHAKVVAAISNIKGNALVKVAESRKYIPAYKGQMLNNGDWVKTGSGVFLGILFLDGSNIKIREETEVKITSYRMTAKELKTKLEIAQGQAYSDIASQGKGEFKIKTPTAVASVKGTEFDIDYDEDEESTSLIVVSGLVSFATELDSILAGAMTSSSAKFNEKPEKPKPVSQNDLPDWQVKDVNATYQFALKPDKSGKQPINKAIRVSVKIINAKSKKIFNKFSGTVSIFSDSEDLKLSKNGNSWKNSLSLNLNDGTGSFYVKSLKPGNPSVSASSDNAESSKVSFSFYQSKLQKKESYLKFIKIAEKAGKSDIIKNINEKKLLESTVLSGQGNIDEVLQKILNGEYVVEVFESTESADGIISVKIKTKPKK